MNYFGEQRFGHGESSSAAVGQSILAGKFVSSGTGFSYFSVCVAVKVLLIVYLGLRPL